MNYLSPDEFKKKILNLKSFEQEDDMMKASVKMEAVLFCSMLPEFFGKDLDRLTLWTRIGSAIETSIVKSNYDIEFFVNLCLEHIKAEHSQVVTHEKLQAFVDGSLVKSDEWKKMFFNYLSTRHFLVIAQARSIWEKKKKERLCETKK